jgi:hypothetical protein
MTIFLIIVRMIDLLSLGDLARLGGEEFNLGVGIIFWVEEDGCGEALEARRREPGGRYGKKTARSNS